MKFKEANWPLVCRKSSVSRKAVVRKFSVGTGVSKIASCKVFARFIEVPDFAVENHLWILFTEKIDFSIFLNF